MLSIKMPIDWFERVALVNKRKVIADRPTQQNFGHLELQCSAEAWASTSHAFDVFKQFIFVIILMTSSKMYMQHLVYLRQSVRTT